jgi:lipopolysaccharide exporter
MSQSSTTGSLRQQAAAGGRWTVMSAIASVVIQLMQLAALGRLLAPADFGLMAMMMVVIALATSIADFGVGNYIVQINVLSLRLFKRLFALSFLLSVMLSAIIAVIAPWVATYYGSPVLADLLPYLGLVVITSAGSQVYFSVLQRALKFQIIAVVDVFSASCGLVVSVGLAWYDYGVWSLIAGQLTLNIIKFICFFITASTALKEVPLACEGRIINAVRFGFFQLGERILNFAGWNLDKIIIGKILGDNMLGIYSVAYQLAMRPFSVLNPIFTRVSLPIFSKIKNDDARLRRGYLDVVRIIGLLSFPVYVGIAISAPAIVYILLGPQWSEAAPVVSILCGLGFIFSLGNPIGSLILAKGRADLGFYYNLFALLTYGIAFYFGSNYGLLGVAIAFVIAAGGILYPLEIFLRWKLVGMGATEYFSAIRNHFSGAALPLLVYIYLKANSAMSENLFNQLMAGAGGASFFIAYLWLTERALIKSTYALVVGGGK